MKSECYNVRGWFLEWIEMKVSLSRDHPKTIKRQNARKSMVQFLKCILNANGNVARIKFPFNANYYFFKVWFFSLCTEIYSQFKPSNIIIEDQKKKTNRWLTKNKNILKICVLINKNTPAADCLVKMVIALKHETLFHGPRTAYKLNIFPSYRLKIEIPKQYYHQFSHQTEIFTPN